MQTIVITAICFVLMVMNNIRLTYKYHKTKETNDSSQNWYMRRTVVWNWLIFAILAFLVGMRYWNSHFATHPSIFQPW